jgi:phenolic acid decarboxylase
MNNWVVIGHAANPETEEMMTYIREAYEVEPKYFATYGNTMAFLHASGLNADHPVAYKDGHLIGDLDNLSHYIKGEENQ